MKKGAFVIIVLIFFVVGILSGYYYYSYKSAKDLEFSYNSLGWEYYRNLEYNKAIEEFNKYTSKNKKNHYAYNGLGWSNYNLGDFSKAVENFEKAVSLDILDDFSYFSFQGLGLSYYQLYSGNLGVSSNLELSENFFKKSESAFKESITLNPGISNNYQGLGQLYFEKAKIDLNENYFVLAEDNFHNALNLDSFNPVLHNFIASSTYFKNLRFHQSELNYSYITSLYEQSLALRPTADAYSGVALMNLKAGNIEKAIENYEKSLELNDQENLNAMHGLGLTLIAQEKYSDAIDYFNDLLKIFPDNLNILRALGISYIENNDYVGAEETFKKTLEIDDGYVPAYLNLIYIYYKQNEFIKSEDMLQKALAIESDLLRINYRPEMIECMDNLNLKYTTKDIIRCYDLAY